VGPLPRELLPLAHEDGHGRREADPFDALEVEEPGEEHAELVRGARPLGREAPVVGELAVAVETERGLGVADIDGEEHRASESERTERRREAAIAAAKRPPPGVFVRPKSARQRISVLREEAC
jgi:hypothetical protein